MLNSCKTKYPILMVHGMGFRDRKYLNYWGRIPKILKENGADIYYGHQDSNGSIETNAYVLKDTVVDILTETGADKVNIIAHSKVGLDARYMISSLGMAEYVASLSTISTPHNGSITMDYILKLPNILIKIGAKIADVWFKILGDKNPDTYKVMNQFTTTEAKKFNENNKDCSNVYYQSFAFVMKSPLSDFIMFLPNIVVSLFEGENDGLLTPRATNWTNFRGIYRGNSKRGISHLDEVDLRRHKLSSQRGDGISDITDFYKSVVEELWKMGH